jgi:hypothetical protein
MEENVGRNAIARFKLSDTGTNVDDFARELVAENDWSLAPGEWIWRVNRNE